MLNIIVCDDDSCFLNRLVEKITAYFRQKEIPFQIASYWIMFWKAIRWARCVIW